MKEIESDHERMTDEFCIVQGHKASCFVINEGDAYQVIDPFQS